MSGKVFPKHKGRERFLNLSRLLDFSTPRCEEVNPERAVNHADIHE